MLKYLMKSLKIIDNEHGKIKYEYESFNCYLNLFVNLDNEIKLYINIIFYK